MAEPFSTPLVPGLLYTDAFLTPRQESSLLHSINAHPRAWKSLHNRTLQNWGGLPHAKGMLPSPLPPFLLPLCAALTRASHFPPSAAPNHVLVNRYQPGQGIAAHEDGPAYLARAAIVSLQSPLVMRFYAASPQGAGAAAATAPTAALLLRPRSLLLLTGPAYTAFYHAIDEVETDNVDATVVNALPHENGLLQRHERTSLTLRTSCKTLRNPLLAHHPRR